MNNKTGRKILCCRCARRHPGAGMTRVMRKIVFHFCPGCWRNRAACELHMRRVAYDEKPQSQEAAA